MSNILFECIVIILLIITNGLLAMAEIAIVSSRKARLETLAGKGNPRARAALDLIADPNRFLSTVQIGITLIGILAGAFGGATLARELGKILGQIPFLSDWSQTIGLGIVVVIVTYLSLVIGELVPKRLGLLNPEKIALFVSRPMHLLSYITAPLVWVLGHSTNTLLRLFGPVSKQESTFTEEDVLTQIILGTKSGIFKKTEQEIMERVFRLEDVRVSAAMTPRPDIDYLDLQETSETNRNRILQSVHSGFPVGSGRLSNLQGVVFSKDILKAQLRAEPFEIKPNLKEPLFVVEGTSLLDVLGQFRRAKASLGMVVDEYGAITGLVTLHDLLEAIIGYLPTEEVNQEAMMMERADGTWLVDGMIPMHEFQHHFHVDLSEGEGRSNYNTLAGFILARLGRIPKVGDQLEAEGILYEIVDMDRNRIDKVLVTPKKSESRA
jgi:putative hemolysin